jgi:hypothetical protein
LPACSAGSESKRTPGLGQVYANGCLARRGNLQAREASGEALQDPPLGEETPLSCELQTRRSTPIVRFAAGSVKAGCGAHDARLLS